tara:strand:+ start:184 stop:588 length:405 start_codon:yes stop_codon:yes gene_type:complete
MKKKKPNMRTVIRQIVREEVAMAIQEVITELKQPNQSQPAKPIQEKKNFSNNSVLNDVLNETAQGGDWKTLGGKEFTTDRMNDIVGKNYTDIANSQPSTNIANEMGVNPDDPAMSFLKKDYRGVMKAIDKKKGK